MMEFTAEMIAGFLGGEVVGDKNAKVHTVSSIEGGKAGSLAYLTNPKYEPFLYTTGASIVLVDRAFTPSQPVAATLVRVDDAAACVVRLLAMYEAAKPRRKGGLVIESSLHGQPVSRFRLISHVSTKRLQIAGTGGLGLRITGFQPQIHEQ